MATYVQIINSDRKFLIGGVVSNVVSGLLKIEQETLDVSWNHSEAFQDQEAGQLLGI